MISVLIVDDDMATVSVIRDSVDWKKLGIEQVYIAYQVAGAKKILKESVVDIIISDIEMPQESGLELLKWVRKENIECEFLLLTCHESFTYAANAISYDAAAYLTKPFDITIMEMNLHKIIDKLMNERKLKKSSEYGAWVQKNLRLMKIDFLKQVLEGEFKDKKHMSQEMKSRGFDMDIEENYILVYSRISNMKEDMERYGKSVFEFILEGFHSELILGQVENESVIKMHVGNTLSFITVCKQKDVNELKSGCNQLIETCMQYFKATLTCCISNSYDIMELANARKNVEFLFGYNVNYMGTTFLESEVEIITKHQIQIIHFEKLVDLVEKKEKAQILYYLKSIFDELIALKNMNSHSLYLMKQEIVQVVYADLMKQGIQATRLFHDEISIQLSERAIESTVDLIRWVNYLLSKTFEYEEEVAKSQTIIERINDFIHANYAQPITRNEIAEEFYLTPSYLAKLYKKKTGVNIKDYINEYRIERAKELLKMPQSNVSEVAKKVGFDNFSYFSTLFKKITGLTPKEYRTI